MEPIPESEITLESLTKKISECSKIISDSIKEHSLPPLSFAVGGPSRFHVPPSETAVQMARLTLVEATSLLQTLVLGHFDTVQQIAGKHHDTAALRVVYRFKMAEAVPSEGDISYKEVADKIGLDEDRTRRIMLFSMTNGLFKQTQPGRVAHTGMSYALATDEDLKAMVGHMTEDVYPAAVANADAFEKYREYDGDPTKTGFQLAFQTELPFFGYLTQHPERLQRLGKAMSSLSMPGGLFDAAYAVRMYDWSSLGEATLVDVGGSRGHVSMAIAKAAPSLKFVIQDHPDVVKDGEAALPEELKSRFEFMPFDFFNSQPSLSSRGNVVYFLRLVLHDWADPYCIKILRNIVPVLKDGSTLLINDAAMPPHGTLNRFLEKVALFTDMQMLSTVNSKERTVTEFEALVREADSRFKMVNVHTVPGSPLSIMEFRFGSAAEKL